MRIGILQYSNRPNLSVNPEPLISDINAAIDKGAQVICLQELAFTSYFCQTEDETAFADAVPVNGAWKDPYAQIAKDRAVVLVLPFFEKRAPGVFHNSALIIDADGSTLGVYRKMHIPDDPGFYEKYYFAPGEEFKTWETRYGKIGVCICWDQWFPEAARLTALSGAQVIFYPTAIGWIPEDRGTEVAQTQLDAWQTMQRSHAIANGCYVAAANRIGQETAVDGSGEILFWGNSFIADPGGKIIAQAGADQPEILVAELDLELLETQRIHWPFLRDRRIDAYDALSQRVIDK
ncbi:MAG: carbon-nitrogen hydrolase [Verrucomicrobiota bacterium]